MRTFVQKPKPGRPLSSGNQVFQKQMPRTGQDGIEANSRAAAITGFGHDFNRISIRPSVAGGLQKKLAISKAGNEYEHEADRVAERVMRMPEPEFAHGGAVPGRKAGQVSQGGVRLQTKHVLAQGMEQVPMPESFDQVPHSPGEALDAGTRAFMESRFGTDFSDVRVHNDSKAHQISRDLNAKAFTCGSDIYFNQRQYSTDSSEGKRLLAHELTHVVQQRNGGASGAGVRGAGGHNGHPAIFRQPFDLPEPTLLPQARAPHLLNEGLRRPGAVPSPEETARRAQQYLQQVAFATAYLRTQVHVFPRSVPYRDPVEFGEWTVQIGVEMPVLPAHPEEARTRPVESLMYSAQARVEHGRIAHIIEPFALIRGSGAIGIGVAAGIEIANAVAFGLEFYALTDFHGQAGGHLAITAGVNIPGLGRLVVAPEVSSEGGTLNVRLELP